LVTGFRLGIMRMANLFFTTAVVVSVPLSSFSQDAEPISAPAEVVLGLGTEGDVHEFLSNS